MMYDKNFLHSLDKQRNKTTYAKITKLTFDEHPIEAIEGKVTSGSISIDGASAIRRTCQVTLVTEKVDISDYNWSLNTKFKLEIGVENNVDARYPNIIWFEQGVYIISSFSAALSQSSYTININGQDKMCLLNGNVGGSINSSVDFGTMEQEIAPQTWQKIKLPIKQIIREMVHAYAGEPFHNIIINDLEEVGLTLQTYNYDKPMFLLREVGSNTYTQGYINQSQEIIWKQLTGETLGTLLNATNPAFKFEQLMGDFLDQEDSDTIRLKGVKGQYTVALINYGDTAGYTEGDLVYPSDLIANVGDSITSVLDKIKNFLGEFEYFYNLHGQFVFQKKKTYEQNTWSPVHQEEDGSTYVSDSHNNDIEYTFTGSEFFTTFNNTVNLQNVKNDFSVWGEKNNSVAVHMRYAIDKKPIMYKSISVTDEELQEYNKKYGLEVKGQSSVVYIAGDKYYNPIDGADALGKAELGKLILGGLPKYWKYDETNELLKLNISKAYRNNVFNFKRHGIYNEVSQTLSLLLDNYIICDWRELIYRMAEDYNKYNHLDDFEQKVKIANPELYTSGKTGYEQYYTDILVFWRLLYNPFASNEDYYDDTNSERFGWSKLIYEHPEDLLFWFDFMDTDGELAKYSVPAVGSRPKSVTDKQVKAIVYKEVPNIIFKSGTTGTGENTAYRYFNVSGGLTMFRQSTQGKSAKDSVDNLLYVHGYCLESVSITSIPIYYLDANTRVYIYDEKTGIDGEYTISKLNLQLSYNGTMSITATKSVNKLI